MARDTQQNDDELDVIELEETLGEVEKPPELPAGNYTGEIVDVQVQNSQKGNQYYAVKFQIPPDDIPADMRDDFEEGCTLYWNRQIKPSKGDRRALFNLRKFVEAIGLDSNTTTIDPNDWMGCTARLKVKHSKNPNSGEWNAQVQSVEPADDPEPAQTSRGRGRQAEPEPEPEPEATTTTRAPRRARR
jgi:hypothetical protein